MYVIIGGDGKEYGPVSGEDLRQWIGEGRLNAQSLAKTEGEAAFRPLATFPEFAGAFAPPSAAPGTPPAFAGPADFAESNYDLDIGGCISRGWDLFKDHFGTLFGSFLLAALILVAVSGMVNLVIMALVPKSWMTAVGFKLGYGVFLQAVLAVVQGPLFGGVFYIFIQRMRGRPAGVGDLFIGFQEAFAQLYLGNFVVAFLVGLCFVPYNILQSVRLEPVLEQMQHASPAEVHSIMPEMWSVLLGLWPVLGLCMIPMIYLTVNWQFTLPLIMDKSMNFWPAMKASWKMIHKHWWRVFGLTGLIVLINVAGLCLCCVGILVTLPLTTAMMMSAYETIFPPSRAAVTDADSALGRGF